jgi:hypothetical protein
MLSAQTTTTFAQQLKNYHYQFIIRMQDLLRAQGMLIREVKITA